MKRKILTIITLLFIVPLNVHALSGSMKITCEKQNITINSSTTCQITATTDGEVSSIHSVINVSDGLEITSVKVDDIWEGDDDKVLDLYTADNKNGTFNVATFVIKATKTGTHNITLNDTKLGDKSFKEHSFSVTTYNVNVSTQEEQNNSSSSSSSSSSAKPSSSSSSKPSSSSSAKPSSSSSSAKPSSSSSSNNQQTIPVYTLELSDNQVLVDNQLNLSFSANTAGILKVTSSNNNILTVSSTQYDLSKNETKIFKLLGKKSGTANVTIEFIPNSKEYKTIKETRQITVKANNAQNSSSTSPNINVEENPETGSTLIIVVSIIGFLIISYSCWYYRKNKQN